MGAGIAQVAAVAGYDVTMQDMSDGPLGRGRRQIQDSLARFEAKGRIPAGTRDSALARIRTVTDLEAASGAEIVVEAVFEDLEVKRDVFRKLDKLAPESAVLATNTSATRPRYAAGLGAGSGDAPDRGQLRAGVGGCLRCGRPARCLAAYAHPRDQQGATSSHR